MGHTKNKSPKKRIKGYWVYKTPKGKAPVTYYVPGHLRERPKPILKARPAPKGYILVEHHDEISVEERVVYTYKISALVEYQKRYIVRFSLDKDLEGELVVEYYHSRFEPTIALATADFNRQMLNLEAYGHVVEFLSIELYSVSGYGHLQDKHWQLLTSFKNLSDVK